MKTCIRAGQQYNGNYNYAAEHQARQQQVNMPGICLFEES